MEASAPKPSCPFRGAIGFIGLGAMGAPMVKHLASLGYELLVHDVNSRAVRSAVEHGARSMPSAEAVASEATVVLTCLPSLGIIEDVVLGAHGLQAGGAIKTFVDLSTTGAEFARRIADRLRQCGIMMLDSPVTGNVVKAGNGQLGIMCSGPAAAYRSVEPIMHDLASAAVLYLGEETGKAQTLKSLNNLLSATGMAVSCEAFILGTKAGLDPRIMLEVINAGDASSSATRNKFSRSVLPRRFDYGARMAITVKDLSTTVNEAEARGVPMWIAQAVRQVWKYAVSQGGADQDGTALITFLEPWAGVAVHASEQDRVEVSLVTAPDGPAGDLLLLCDTPATASFARRLRQRGWDVHIGAEEAATGGDQSRRCTIVGVDAGTDPTDILMAMTPSANGRRFVINACPMATAQAARLAQAASDRGSDYLDALLAGPPGDAEARGCAVLAGGSYASFVQAKSLLCAIAAPVFHVSETPGLAHLMQQIEGSLSATLLAVACEAFVVGAKAGLDPLTMSTIMGVESGRNAASIRIIPEEVATRRFGYGKSVAESYRELSLLSEEARNLGVTPWILDTARLLYGLANQLGNPQDDVTRLVTHYEKWAGTEVRLGPAASAPDQDGAPHA